MNIVDVQCLLTATGYYKGGLDGDLGRRTRAGIKVIERTQAKQYNTNPTSWGWKRRAVATGQAILNAWGYEAGSIDGFAGHNTKEAYRAWQYKGLHKRIERVTRQIPNTYVPAIASDIILPRQRDCVEYYGIPGKDSGTVRQQLTIVELPFNLRIDWNVRQRTNKIRVHEKCAASLETALISVHKHYGLPEMQRLGIDRYAGAYNPRKMRGGTKWSMHAYGCAIDFYAAPNGLRVSCPKALFCKAEYKDFLDIMEMHGWLPAIRLWGKDAMHFQAAWL